MKSICCKPANLALCFVEIDALAGLRVEMFVPFLRDKGRR